MLSRALRLSLALEVTFYLALAIFCFDASLVGALLITLLAMLSFRALLMVFTYVFSWACRSSWPPLSPGKALLMVLGEYAAFVLYFVVIFPFERWWMGEDRLSSVVGQGAAPSGEEPRVRPPVLLIHGYGCSRAAWWWLRPRLEMAGWPVATISLEPLYTSIDNYVDPLARRIDALLAESAAERVIVVGHSMGGLVARAYLQRYGDSRVARLITLGTPHRGSQLALLGFGENARQMRPDSAWLQALAAPAPALEALAIYSPHDNFVMPPFRLEMPGGANQAIGGIGHLAMLCSPRVAEALLAALERNAVEPARRGDVGGS
ncbi:esterase/lipase family protein [Accumulibacter sp.]|uniref:esterase/lipase family protein n=1 Tax=Accumulibacter sp. TaxID=2053492 RepID=UPI0028C44DEF|nr:alpha/beta fold hydrolase [Accumulibacter sp.]